jgi:hypothetical protein
MPAVIVTSKKCPLISTVAGKKLFGALDFRECHLSEAWFLSEGWISQRVDLSEATSQRWISQTFLPL